MPAVELQRSDVERLVGVEKDVKFLVERAVESAAAQKELDTKVTLVMQNHAVQMDREKRTNRLWSVAAGLLGGLLPGLLGKH